MVIFFLLDVAIDMGKEYKIRKIIFLQGVQLIEGKRSYMIPGKVL